MYLILLDGVLLYHILSFKINIYFLYPQSRKVRYHNTYKTNIFLERTDFYKVDLLKITKAVKIC